MIDRIEPMKAKPSDVSFLKSVSNDPNWVAGEKLDGYRELWYIGAESSELLSSAGNSHVDRVPQFKLGIPALAGTVLDCEGLSPTRRLEDNASCFKASPESTIAWQKQHGYANLHIFDIIRYCDETLMHKRFCERRVYLEHAFSLVASIVEQVQLEELVSLSKFDYYSRIIARTQTEGHEGIILKDIHAPYVPGKRGNAWLKVKRLESLVYEIIGFYPGVGKFDGMVGSIIYGLDGKALGSASGMDDNVRRDMTAYPDTYIGHKALFECQEITDNGVMRHPRYISLA